MTNDEVPMTKKPDACVLMQSGFVIANSFVIRHSDFLRHSSFVLRHLVTGRILLAVAIGLLATSSSRGQEPSPSPSPSATPARSVRISFVPPPLEGKISLGVYNEWNQLVRVLHQEAEFDEFNIGADALSTKWDGKDDYDYDLPAGKYSARGFLVAPMKIEAETTTTGAAASGASSVRIKLVANPLENNERPTVDICAGFDNDDAYLQTVNGLPLVTVAKRQEAKSVSLAAGRDNKSVIVFLGNGANVRQVEVGGITKMMAFDCGTFELK
jgi:hypothetical protein